MMLLDVTPIWSILIRFVINSVLFPTENPPSFILVQTAGQYKVSEYEPLHNNESIHYTQSIPVAKQDCAIADDTDVIKLTVWENHISAVKAGVSLLCNNNLRNLSKGYGQGQSCRDQGIEADNCKPYLPLLQ